LKLTIGAKSLPHADKIPPLVIVAETEVNLMMKSRLELLVMVVIEILALIEDRSRQFTLQFKCDDKVTPILNNEVPSKKA
jgi:hypothetical protein